MDGLGVGGTKGSDLGKRNVPQKRIFRVWGGG
jgi:hypothetical protein